MVLTNSFDIGRVVRVSYNMPNPLNMLQLSVFQTIFLTDGPDFFLAYRSNS